MVNKKQIVWIALSLSCMFSVLSGKLDPPKELEAPTPPRTEKLVPPVAPRDTPHPIIEVLNKQAVAGHTEILSRYKSHVDRTITRIKEEKDSPNKLARIKKLEKKVRAFEKEAEKITAGTKGKLIDVSNASHKMLFDMLERIEQQQAKILAYIEQDKAKQKEHTVIKDVSTSEEEEEEEDEDDEFEAQKKITQRKLSGKKIEMTDEEREDALSEQKRIEQTARKNRLAKKAAEKRKKAAARKAAAEEKFKKSYRAQKNTLFGALGVGSDDQSSDDDEDEDDEEDDDE